MIPPLGIAVRAATAALSQQQSDPRAILNGGAIEIMLPLRVFKNEQLTKYLDSGLTTAIVISVEDEGDRRGGARGAMRIEIRYDLWDEIYRVTRPGPDEKPEQLTLPSTVRLDEWLTTTRFHIADAVDGRAPLMVRVTVDVVPFSASEQEDAQRWLLHSMRDAERSQNGGIVTRADRNNAGGAFDRMIAGSVQPKAVLSWHWNVPVSPP